MFNKLYDRFFKDYPTDEELIKEATSIPPTLPDAQPLINKIVLWKLNRIIGLDDGNLQNLFELVQKRKDKQNLCKKEKELIDKLLEVSGLGLPMLSTILHVLNPERFPIIDVRANRELQFWEYCKENKEIYCEQLTSWNDNPELHEKQLKKRSSSSSDNFTYKDIKSTAEYYADYIEKCHTYNKKLDIKDFKQVDKILYVSDKWVRGRKINERKNKRK